MRKETINKKDWTIDKEDFNTTYARILSRNPKEMKLFKKHIIAEYNKTKELPVLLEQLKILAKVGGIAELAKDADIIVNFESNVLKIFKIKDLLPYFFVKDNLN